MSNSIIQPLGYHFVLEPTDIGDKEESRIMVVGGSRDAPPPFARGKVCEVPVGYIGPIKEDDVVLFRQNYSARMDEIQGFKFYLVPEDEIVARVTLRKEV